MDSSPILRHRLRSAFRTPVRPSASAAQTRARRNQRPVPPTPSPVVVRNNIGRLRPVIRGAVARSAFDLSQPLRRQRRLRYTRRSASVDSQASAAAGSGMTVRRLFETLDALPAEPVVAPPQPPVPVPVPGRSRLHPVRRSASAGAVRVEAPAPQRQGITVRELFEALDALPSQPVVVPPPQVPRASGPSRARRTVAQFFNELRASCGTDGSRCHSCSRCDSEFDLPPPYPVGQGTSSPVVREHRSVLAGQLAAALASAPSNIPFGFSFSYSFPPAHN